jgi:uncharacterized sulfatase
VRFRRLLRQRHLRPRAALLSGRYGTRFGFEHADAGMSTIVPRLRTMPGRLRPAIRLEGEDGAFDAMGMPASEITLAELLKQADYHTVHIGKWHLGGENGMAAHEQGFDESLLMANGLYLPEDDARVVNRSRTSTRSTASCGARSSTRPRSTAGRPSRRRAT